MSLISLHNFIDNVFNYRVKLSIKKRLTILTLAGLGEAPKRIGGVNCVPSLVCIVPFREKQATKISTLNFAVSKLVGAAFLLGGKMLFREIKEPRSFLFGMKITKSESDWLRARAMREGLSKSSLVRKLLAELASNERSTVVKRRK